MRGGGALVGLVLTLLGSLEEDESESLPQEDENRFRSTVRARALAFFLRADGGRADHILRGL